MVLPLLIVTLVVLLGRSAVVARRLDRPIGRILDCTLALVAVRGFELRARSREGAGR